MEAFARTRHDLLSPNAQKRLRRMVVQVRQFAVALQVALVDAWMVDVGRHPVGNSYSHDDGEHKVDPSGALHDDDHQGDGGAKHPAQHGGGSDERVHSRLDVPGGQPLHKARAHQPPEGGAQHDGGHEQAAGHRRAARQRHQNHVREGVNREGLAAKVLLVLAVRLLPGAQKQLDGVLGEGEEERGQLVVLAFRTKKRDAVRFHPHGFPLRRLLGTHGECIGQGEHEPHADHHNHHSLRQARRAVGLGGAQLGQPAVQDVEYGSQHASKGSHCEKEGQLLRPVGSRWSLESIQGYHAGAGEVVIAVQGGEHKDCGGGG
mmetsp:Transcript_30813/g.58015  ORF Transcript_30813/g.58015 Transcript_30813/m.58015 type:complete len:318 (-) Transcript_30813:641-1594(-)